MVSHEEKDRAAGSSFFLDKCTFLYIIMII